MQHALEWLSQKRRARMATIIHQGVKAFACIFAGLAVYIGTIALPPVTLGADAQSQRLLPHQFTRGEGVVGVWWGEVDAVLAGIPFPKHWSRRPTAYAALQLPGAAEAQRAALVL
jgi:hypothetical protein